MTAEQIVGTMISLFLIENVIGYVTINVTKPMNITFDSVYASSTTGTEKMGMIFPKHFPKVSKT